MKNVKRIREILGIQLILSYPTIRIVNDSTWVSRTKFLSCEPVQEIGCAIFL